MPKARRHSSHQRRQPRMLSVELNLGIEHLRHLLPLLFGPACHGTLEMFINRLTKQFKPSIKMLLVYRQFGVWQKWAAGVGALAQ